CDPRWTEVLEVYAASRIADKTIPYRRHTNPGDFVISNRLPAKATVALLGDWGTGQEAAKQLLVRIAARHPDAVIHLGDVYYSGTKHEVQNYFYSIWQKILGIPKVAWGEKLTDLSKTPATFHLAGNHDMYAGGQPYYSVIDMLGQPASYFCLRNEHWQFLAMDTGLHDSNPSREGDPTWLEDTEVEWLKDKIRNAGGRKTILLSHHQLFTAFEDIGKAPINGKLLSQLQDVLPQVTAWFWGHEHNLVIYGKYLNVLGRCIGHGAFPVQPEELRAPNPDIPLNPVTLAKDTKGFFEHGYVTMELDGADAHVTYYQYDPNSGAETVLFSETL
ncbi:MAG TPA: metallophosphoesterase, partial [Bryobacteraceae bacterium]|nr:metallophosphoesterase [Bryobacteraceae bacterium]